MRIIAVDFQKDFTASDGACYRVRPCVNFILETLVPHCRKHGLRIAEIDQHENRESVASPCHGRLPTNT